jgi:uncharacterized protein (DUF1778 family)
MSDEIRRRKPDSQRKSEYLRIRLTPEQAALFKEVAAQAGIALSAWAVERLVREARREKRQK